MRTTCQVDAGTVPNGPGHITRAARSPDCAKIHRIASTCSPLSDMLEPTVGLCLCAMRFSPGRCAPVFLPAADTGAKGNHPNR